MPNYGWALKGLERMAKQADAMVARHEQEIKSIDDHIHRLSEAGRRNAEKYSLYTAASRCYRVGAMFFSLAMATSTAGAVAAFLAPTYWFSLAMLPATGVLFYFAFRFKRNGDRFNLRAKMIPGDSNIDEWLTA